MEKQIDLLKYLSRVVQENTRAYQEDFQYDVRKITESVRESHMEDRVFYWMSRPAGTWCVKERDVFLRESEGHAIWTHYAPVADEIRAFRIVVTGLRDGVVVSAAGEARPGGAGKKRNVPCSTREILARAREWLESADQDR